jgi:hypothetical protein
MRLKPHELNAIMHFLRQKHDEANRPPKTELSKAEIQAAKLRFSELQVLVKNWPQQMMQDVIGYHTHKISLKEIQDWYLDNRRKEVKVKKFDYEQVKREVVVNASTIKTLDAVYKHYRLI